MAEKREIIACSVYNARGVYINRLWEPETKEFNSDKPLDKPRYSVVGIIPKTKANWMEEPTFASILAATQRIYAQNYQGWPLERLIWPVKDGDLPNRQGKVSDWAKGHWLVRADTTSPSYLTIEAIQNGKAIPLPAAKMGGRAIVKDGDFLILAVGIAKSEGPNAGFKTYLNGVVFTGPGEEIQLGTRIDTEELVRQAAAQGIPVQGFGAPTPAGFGAQSGFGAPGGTTPAFGSPAAPPAGFPTAAPAAPPAGGMQPAFQMGPAGPQPYQPAPAGFPAPAAAPQAPQAPQAPIGFPGAPGSANPFAPQQ